MADRKPPPRGRGGQRRQERVPDARRPELEPQQPGPRQPRPQQPRPQQPGPRQPWHQQPRPRQPWPQQQQQQPQPSTSAQGIPSTSTGISPFSGYRYPPPSCTVSRPPDGYDQNFPDISGEGRLSTSRGNPSNPWAGLHTKTGESPAPPKPCGRSSRPNNDDLAERQATEGLQARLEVEQLAGTVAAVNLGPAGAPPPGGSIGRASSSRGTGRGRQPKEYIQQPESDLGFYGHEGTAKTMYANYFQIRQLPRQSIYMYNCVFAPEVINPRVKRVIVGNQRSNFGSDGTFCFDGGSSLYLPNLIDNQRAPRTYTCALRNGDNVQITFNLVREIDATNDEFVQLLNVLMRRNQQYLGMQQLNRSYFDESARQQVEGYRMEVWPGFVTSIRKHQTHMLLMVDYNSKVLRTDTVHDQMAEIQHRSRNPSNVTEEVKRQLLGAIVVTKYNNNTYRIDDINFDGSPRDTFTKGQEQVNYIDYYKNNWDLQIKDPDQPLIITRPSRRDRNAGRNENIVLIPELCCMTGLTEDMRGDFNLMRNLGRITRKGPDERVRSLLQFMSRIKGNEQCVDSCQRWGLEYASNLTQVKARQMRPEKIEMGGASQEVDSRADWTNMLKKGNLDHSVAVKTWILVFSQRDQGVANTFVNTLKNAGRSLNLTYADPLMIGIPDIRTSSFVNGINSGLRQRGKPDIVVVLLPNKNKAIYDAVKKRLVLDESLPSQCVVTRTISDQRKAMSACTKIGLQMNIKMGALAWHVQIPLSHTMIMGFDTYHDSSQRNRSVGGFVASLNRNCSQWFSVAVHHFVGEEVGTRMRPLFQAAMLKYREVNGRFPERFIMYRDGVSDGQLELISSEEVPQIKEQAAAMLKIEPNAVSLAYVICNKRINTRFFEPAGPRMNNPTPGTVVDNTVTRPYRYIFYIVPQSVNQGTVTPTQFVVCYQNTTLNPDHMQRLAYKMCHQYFNWPGTIRVPAPCQYAHKLAFLTGQSLHQTVGLNSPLNETLYYL